MNIEKTIVSYRSDYGKIIFKFNEMLDKNNMSKSQLSLKTGIKYQVITKWCKGNIDRMDIDVLTKIWYVLDCEISDVMEYIKED